MRTPAVLPMTCLALVLAVSAEAQLLEVRGNVVTNDVTPLYYKFKANRGTLRAQFSVETQPGSVSFEFHSADGKLLGKQGASVAAITNWTLSAHTTAEYELTVSPHRTAGNWHVRVDQGPVPDLRPLYGACASGILMMMVALGTVIVWRVRTGVQWRWFWAGAGVWTAGVILKFTVAIPMNILLFANGVRVTGLKLILGTIYCGLMTGIFEIGITLAAALVWRQLAAGANRAVAVGAGAGAFEAMMLGLASLAGPLIALISGYQLDENLKALGTAGVATSLLWLAGPVERVIAILSHTASRVLVLRAVGGRRWAGFWGGFALLSGVDLVAGYALLTGMNVSGSVWRIELLILPFGILSLPVTVWALRDWPVSNVPNLVGPAEAKPSEHLVS